MSVRNVGQSEDYSSEIVDLVRGYFCDYSQFPSISVPSWISPLQ